MDLRKRVVAAVDRGLTQEQAAATFGMSVNTVVRIRPAGETPAAWRRPHSGTGPKPKKSTRLQAWLPTRLQVAADGTLAEHTAAFAAEQGMAVSLATMSRAITTIPADDPAGAVTSSGRRRHRAGR